MKKIFLALLLMSCSPPPFSVSTCLNECNKCNIGTCEQICNDLEGGLNSTECHDVSLNVWNCSVVAGCNFTSTCSQEVSDFLECI